LKQLYYGLLATPVELGGPGVIVQIDESLFNHKSKYNRGRRASKEQWVFGLADTSSKPAITYMEPVDKRDAATLLPMVMRDLLKNDPARMVRYVQRFGHLWLAQCHPKPSLAI
jgi:hypothetical protein